MQNTKAVIGASAVNGRIVRVAVIHLGVKCCDLNRRPLCELRLQHPECEANGRVIPPFLMGVSRRIHAAVFSFIAGVMLPMAMLGRSLL